MTRHDTNRVSPRSVTRSQGPIPGRSRGSIDELPSGALRVRVYAGVDPVSNRRHDLIEIIPPGPEAGRQARRVRDRLISQVEERRNHRTKATVDQLLERYLKQFDGTASTLALSVRWTRISLTRSTQPCVDAGTIARAAFRSAPHRRRPSLRPPVRSAPLPATSCDHVLVLGHPACLRAEALNVGLEVPPLNPVGAHDAASPAPGGAAA
jgi:hypothetical protein